MLIHSTYRYIFILIFSTLAILGTRPAFAQTADTIVADTSDVKLKKKDLAGHQLCLGIDIVRPVENAFLNNRYGYEVAGDYYMHNEFYGTLEGGWGGSNVAYTDLKYTTRNDFIRLGFNKTILTRERPTDWDMMFMGLRLGLANVSRSNASYTVTDSLWGNTSGGTKGANFAAVWLELTGGMRVELVKGLFAGWNIRGKFMMNGKSFNSLSPLYIAGYGQGDKNSAFDFNVYVSYAVRWKRKGVVDTVKAPAPTQ